MAKRTSKFDTILIADDEPMNLRWLMDFIDAKGFKSELATNASDAIRQMSQFDFAGILVDLNIPVGDKPEPLIDARGQQSALYSEFPGLTIAKKALYLLNSGLNVIIYSVYQNEDIAREVYDLNCVCINKGQPQAIKIALLDVLSRAGNKKPKKSTKATKKKKR